MGVLALLGVAASATLFVTGGNTRRKLEEKVSSADTRSAQLETKLEETLARATSLQQQLATLDADLGEAKSRATVAEARSVQAGREISSLRAELGTRQQAEEALNSELAELKRELVETKLAATGASPEDVERYRTTISELEGKVTELQRLVEAATRPAPEATPARAGLVSAPSATVAATAAPRPVAENVSARVVSVGPANAFVVINYGLNAGAQAGQNLAINRGTETLATVQISDVRESLSIAQVLPGSLRGALRKGDSASISN
ncbi:MAG TPA: hypothetical protein VGD81_00310 [Opitutaceae bacterium]